MGVFINGYAPRSVSYRWTSVVVTPPAIEPLSLAEVKARARIDTTDEDALVWRDLRAAREQVEQETHLALLTQTRDVYLDGLVYDASPFTLPWPPLQSVTSVKYTDTAGVLQTWAASNYYVDANSYPGRIALTAAGVWPTDLRVFQPWVIRMVVGWTTPDLIPAPLVKRVAKYAVHSLTAGRDFAMVGSALDEVPDGYAAYRQVCVA